MESDLDLPKLPVSSRSGIEEANISATNICKQGVIIRNAVKGYGVGSRHCTILDGLNMTVNKGSIYGLLGASGCGKTTLLSCIVGRRSLNSGEILVFGDEPGSPDSGIPGPRVGYMPQELALCGDFSIKETLQYFGHFYNLSPTFVKSQIESLSKLLNLPESNRPVKTLSGGQQRRVSFTVALFHQPDLLILDEPTVGVDPLLRQSIWNYLIDQSVNYGRTVIVTTHYIEEARQANAIGMMRTGRLLVEDSPENLLRNFGGPTLEDVFLKLCLKDVADMRKKALVNAAKTNAMASSSAARIQQTTIRPDANDNININDISEIGEEHLSDGMVNLASSTPELEYSGIITPVCKNDCKCKTAFERRSNSKKTIPSFRHTGTLIRKSIKHTIGNINMFFFIFFLPTIQTILFCLGIGRDPTSLKMAIVNDEFDMHQGYACNYTTSCDYWMLSCRYLAILDPKIDQIPFSSLSDAQEAAKNNEVWGVLHFAQNFSTGLETRLLAGDNKISNDTLASSNIGISMDYSNQPIALFLQAKLVTAFEKFTKDLFIACNYEPAAAGIPVTFLDPVFGKENAAFTEFMAPGIVLSIVFFMAIALTSGVFIYEKSEGLLDRSLVAGVQMTEILLAHLVTQFLVMCGQTVLVFVTVLGIFQVPCAGNLALAVLITLLQGLSGMSIGLVVSSACDNAISAIQLAVGIFFSFLLFSGIVWPIEGMSVQLRYFSYTTPQTYAIDALRSIFARGWGIEEPDIYWGIAITIAWILGPLAMSVIILRVRKYTG